MIKIIEDLFTKLGIFNHAAVCVVLMVPIYLFLHFLNFNKAEWVAALLMIFGYYFREVTQAQAYSKLRAGDAYNPLKWKSHDRNQTIILIIISLFWAWIADNYLI